VPIGAGPRFSLDFGWIAPSTSRRSEEEKKKSTEEYTDAVTREHEKRRAEESRIEPAVVKTERPPDVRVAESREVRKSEKHDLFKPICKPSPGLLKHRSIRDLIKEALTRPVDVEQVKSEHKPILEVAKSEKHEEEHTKPRHERPRYVVERPPDVRVAESRPSSPSQEKTQR